MRANISSVPIEVRSTAKTVLQKAMRNLDGTFAATAETSTDFAETRTDVVRDED
jgi:hypothetical protein